MTYYIALAALLVLLAVLQLLDVLSTNRFLKLGTGTEANPLDAWAQKTLGANWWVIKLLFIPLGVVLWIMPAPIGAAAAGVLCALYAYNDYRNYTI